MGDAKRMSPAFFYRSITGNYCQSFLYRLVDGKMTVMAGSVHKGGVR